jgi:hypothetical protein
MTEQPKTTEVSARPSRLIAEALVGRHGPRVITTRAQALGVSRQFTDVIVHACSATAVDASWIRRRQLAAAAN